MSDRLYAERNIVGLWPHYIKHVLAMTGEELHDKGAIAAELAWRDSEIERLTAELATLKQAQEPVAWYDPTNINPGRSVTFCKVEHERWPHLYPVPLIEAPKPGEPT